MKWLLAFAALAEAVTGVALMAAPLLVGRLLLASEFAGVATVVARIFGIGLLSLGIACWPAKTRTSMALAGMLTYGALVTSYLAFLGVRGEWVGPLLWPAVALHAILTVLLTIVGVGLWRRTSVQASEGRSS